MRLSVLLFYVCIYMLVGEGNGTPLQYSCLENPMGRGAWWAAVHGVTNSQTWLSDFTFTFHFHALEKEMATHSSVLAWRIPGMGEPGGLPPMGSHRVRHDWSDLAAVAAAYMLVCVCGGSTCVFIYYDQIVNMYKINIFLAEYVSVSVFADSHAWLVFFGESN